MTIVRCSAIAIIGLCSMLGGPVSCSSDDSPAGGDAQTHDASNDGTNANDVALPDAMQPDVTATDIATDTMRADALSPDAVSSDASVDIPLVDGPRLDRNADDASTDETSVDAPSSDATSTDSKSSDALADSSIDASSGDSSPSDAPFGDGANDPNCPPSPNLGVQCSGNTFCVYPQQNCRCMPACGPPPPPDAGNRWYCNMRGAGCPIQKPVEGTPCSMDAQTCDYGACCTDWMICTSGAWKPGVNTCPP